MPGQLGKGDINGRAGYIIDLKLFSTRFFNFQVLVLKEKIYVQIQCLEFDNIIVLQSQSCSHMEKISFTENYRRCIESCETTK